MLIFCFLTSGLIKKCPNRQFDYINPLMLFKIFLCNLPGRILSVDRNPYPILVFGRNLV